MSENSPFQQALPPVFEDWFASRGWQPRSYQLKMIDAFNGRQSTLLIAPTGAGKTLSGFLPSLVNMTLEECKHLHTLYISPLKALANDIQRNLTDPVEQMGLNISIETRTGDTPSHKRQRQRRLPPNILLTTPESLMLMLSYADAPRIFSRLKCVIVDEVHSFVSNKRGDFTTLALARLTRLAGHYVRFGLSATVAEPQALATWLGSKAKPAELLIEQSPVLPDIKVVEPSERMPYGGFMAKYAVADIYAQIKASQMTLVFVNTRAQVELMFQMLWEHNRDALPIAIYHGSLSKEQRHKTESMMAKGMLRAIVTTSALELGIDWGDVDVVIQVGAPKGVSRLLQRIGRSNHRMDEPSQALMVPANRFEALECEAAMSAIKAQKLDGEPGHPGSLDIVPQYILNCLCSEADTPDVLFDEIRNAQPYFDLTREDFDKLFEFTENGGYALKYYDRYCRLSQDEEGRYQPANKRVIQRHRQNIGTIVEAGRLKVKRLRRKHQGQVVGEVEEYFAQQLVPGDTFLFAGEVLKFEGIRDMFVEASPSKGGEPKIPSYVGGQLPLSTFLAEGVRQLLNEPSRWSSLSPQVREWLDLQQAFSELPGRDSVLIEQFPYRKAFHTLFYTFEGRKANQTLGMLVTKRMERLGLKPLSFSVTDYGLSVCSLVAFGESAIPRLFHPDILGDELEDWMLEAPMLKRSFRRVAVVSGLTEQNYHATRKSMKQVTFSTDLIYDTLREYDPDHILLKVARQDAERELLDLSRLADLLIRFVGKVRFRALTKVSPMAIPIVLDVRSEQVKGVGVEALLEQASLMDEADQLMQDVRDYLEQTD
ncbi:ligase-associated DNA damage response DEXH box helicase [Aestuariibacter salexigens]|uniref:ligase-associated DNA damage response DEXH box helicase n=1 Tax=Aestuariibacter salexigens TaxID=226010 RepID=UPI00047AE166|nr:ligase-associated DNA damage response DEXH box helicase [Aestuariibacter salexigens]